MSGNTHEGSLRSAEAHPIKIEESVKDNRMIIHAELSDVNSDTNIFDQN
jgi:hypothetical protein